MKAPAIYLGIQAGYGTIEPLVLFNLTADIPGHNAGSTVTDVTLRALGYEVPDWREAECGECGGTMGNHEGECNL